AFDGLALEVELARDSGINGVKEAQMLAQPSLESHGMDWLSIFAGLMLDNLRKPEAVQAFRDPTDDLEISVRHPPHGLAEAPLSIENPCKKTLGPTGSWV